jgi:hypothetical protein
MPLVGDFGVKGMNGQAKALWGVFWRMLVFVPIGLVGILALVVVVGLTGFAPLYAIIIFIDGRYILGAFISAAWLVWLRVGGRARRFVFEGFEHGSL